MLSSENCQYSPGRVPAWKAACLFLILCLGAQYLFIWTVYQGWVPGKFYTIRIFIPLMAASVASVWYCGRGAFKMMFGSLFKWRCHWQWYVFSLVWLTLISFLLLVLENLIMGRGFARIPLDFSNVDVFNPDAEQAQIARSILRGSAMIAIVEEIALVSCFMTLLRQYLTPLVTSLITSVFWCSWWVPAILIGDGVTAGLPIPLLYIQYIGLAATCIWVYHFTGSALLVIVMQFITNMVSLIIPVLPDSGGYWTYVVYVVSMCVLIFLLFEKWGPKPLWREESSSTDSPKFSTSLPTPVNS